MDVFGDTEIEGVGVEDVGGVDDRRRVAGGDVAGGQGAADLAAAGGVDQRAAAAEEVKNRQVRAGLLRVADDVEGGQVGQPPQDDGGVVHERRRAEPPRQLGDPEAGNFTPRVAVHQRCLVQCFRHGSRCRVGRARRAPPAEFGGACCARPTLQLIDTSKRGGSSGDRRCDNPYLIWVISTGVLSMQSP